MPGNKAGSEKKGKNKKQSPGRILCVALIMAAACILAMGSAHFIMKIQSRETEGLNNAMTDMEIQDRNISESLIEENESNENRLNENEFTEKGEKKMNEQAMKDEAVKEETKKALNPFGKRTYVFTPDDPPEKVSAILEELWEKQEANQFGDDRYAVLFMPGEYDESIVLKTGFYTQMSGLGKKPTDTRLGGLYLNARWMSDDPSNHMALCNFWRGIENLQIGGDATWAVSQATFFRRMAVEGSLYLHDEYGWASGGFLADSYVKNMIDSGSQQQWLTRNSKFSSWMGENWNLVFMGDGPGCDPVGTWPGRAYTSVEKTPVIAEKPYLCYSPGEGYCVVNPALRKDCSGMSWTQDDRIPKDKMTENGMADDRMLSTGEDKGDTSIPLDEFYIADPDRDTAASINEALKDKKHLLLTPGIYELEDSIRIDRAGTIVLGMGLATLRPMTGKSCMETADEDGIVLAGILFDAGPKKSDYLLSVGRKDKSHEDDPIRLYDLFFRVGGASDKYDAKADTCVVLNSNDVIGDNFWVWRADHGDNVGWDQNTSKTGIRIEGDRNYLYALMVEHFSQYQTIWNGEGGVCVMYQSEMPYDVPKQSAWNSAEGRRHGFASFKVGDDVQAFEGIALGIYSYHRDTPVEAYCGMEVPKRKGVHIHNICTVMLNGNPGITHVINDDGDAVMHGGERAIIVDYADGRIVK
ncbi:MAG: sialidase [Lachnospiraceae bacterium]|nr:sialidase [Lachnospiraceae bacterium]